MAALRANRADVLVLDLRLPRLDGLSLIRDMQAEGITVRVLVFTATPESADVVEAVRLGVRGVVPKSAESAVLVDIVRRVHAGERCVEPALLARAEEAPQDLPRAADVLTTREIDMARMVAIGLRNRNIADQMGISEGTVKIHLHNIYRKLGMQSRVQLTLYARDQGLT
jgi:DNA-binding NarL/FixJ family response regulator